MLEQKRLGNDGTGTARSEQASQGSDEMDEKDDQIAHHRILAGREIPMNYGRNNNSPATGSRLTRSVAQVRDSSHYSQHWLLRRTPLRSVHDRVEDGFVLGAHRRPLRTGANHDVQHQLLLVVHPVSGIRRYLEPRDLQVLGWGR